MSIRPALFVVLCSMGRIIDLDPILVVEDDERVLEAITDFLATVGYPVNAAHNGEEAIDRARSVHPSLILLDMSMPVMDGWEFLRRRPAEPSIANVPVIVISALVSRTPEGADGFLTKPIDVSRLLSILDRYCGEPGAVH
jgi:CheY-like chemotaxis protein